MRQSLLFAALLLLCASCATPGGRNPASTHGEAQDEASEATFSAKDCASKVEVSAKAGLPFKEIVAKLEECGHGTRSTDDIILLIQKGFELIPLQLSEDRGELERMIALMHISLNHDQMKTADYLKLIDAALAYKHMVSMGGFGLMHAENVDEAIQIHERVMKHLPFQDQEDIRAIDVDLLGYAIQAHKSGLGLSDCRRLGREISTFEIRERALAMCTN